MNQVAQMPNNMATPPIETGESSVFSSLQKFQEVQQMGGFLAASDLVPTTFKGKPENCVIALEMANRLKADPIMVMQNLYIVHGKPAWSAQFLISCVNSCGRFSALQYKFFGTRGQEDWGCYAYAKELATGEEVRGPEVTIKMANDEGWSKKNGSKWKTMPELMMTYRAATFFARTKAPEVSMGMHTEEEVRDMGKAEIVANEQKAKDLDAQVLDSLPPADEKPSVDVVTFYKQSIDSCGDLDSLMLCGQDIASSAADMTEQEHHEVKMYFDQKLKAYKAQQSS